MTIRKYVREGEIMPRGYGAAYISDFSAPQLSIVCYPIPLNWIVARSREIWAYLATCRDRSLLTRAWLEGYVAGRESKETHADKG